jgi:hypothetical protein
VAPGDRRTSYAPPLVETKGCRERLTLDECAVALDPAVRGEDEEVEPDCERLAGLGDRLPMELDDVAERSASSRPRKLSPSEPTQCSYALAASSLDRRVSLCVRITRRP